jgi:hypothetical protein
MPIMTHPKSRSRSWQPPVHPVETGTLPANHGAGGAHERCGRRPRASTPLANAKHEAVALAYIADPEKIGWRAYRSVYAKSSQHAAETQFGTGARRSRACCGFPWSRQSRDGTYNLDHLLDILEQTLNIGPKTG